MSERSLLSWFLGNCTKTRPPRRRCQPLQKKMHLETLEDRKMLAAQPLITELMAASITKSPADTAAVFDSISDPTAPGERYPDWIEICNFGDESVDLDGWYLTDSKQDLHKWQFPRVGTILQENDCVVVFALPGKGDYTTEGELHTNFRLGQEGEYLALVQPDDTIASHYDPFYPQFLDPDVYKSYGLTAGSDDEAFFERPTPGEPNPPLFEGVFYPTQRLVDTAIKVVLNPEQLQGPIYYTTNGASRRPATLYTTVTYRSIRQPSCEPGRFEKTAAQHPFIHSRTSSPAKWPINLGFPREDSPIRGSPVMEPQPRPTMKWIRKW